MLSRKLFPPSSLPRLCCSLRRLGIVAAVLLAGAVLLPAQTDTGTIRGYVYDETRAVLPGVSVTATYQGRGVAREALTSDLGEYVLSRVDPGLYTLRFELPGFAPYVVQDLRVLVGETQTFSPEIVVAAEAIVITAEATRTVIARDKTQQSNHIDSTSIEDLPINRRDYLDLALLTPGVVDSNYVADDRDFRIAPTPASGLGIGGGGGRGNTFTIDGLNNNYGTGAVRSSITQEAVQEFQINRNSFSAELGGAPGGAINIVTKGGTNEFRGSIFGVLRNRHFQSRNYFDPSESAYTRAQSGGSFGGPIRRDRTFFFTAYERLDRHESSFVPLLQDRSFLYELKALAEGPGRFAHQSRGSALSGPGGKATRPSLDSGKPSPRSPVVREQQRSLPLLGRTAAIHRPHRPCGGARTQSLLPRKLDRTEQSEHQLRIAGGP